MTYVSQMTLSFNEQGRVSNNLVLIRKKIQHIQTPNTCWWSFLFFTIIGLSSFSLACLTNVMLLPLLHARTTVVTIPWPWENGTSSTHGPLWPLWIWVDFWKMLVFLRTSLFSKPFLHTKNSTLPLFVHKGLTVYHDRQTALFQIGHCSSHAKLEPFFLHVV